MGMQRIMSWAPSWAANAQMIVFCWGQNDEVTFYGVTVKSVDLILPASYLFGISCNKADGQFRCKSLSTNQKLLLSPVKWKVFRSPDLQSALRQARADNRPKKYLWPIIAGTRPRLIQQPPWRQVKTMLFLPILLIVTFKYLYIGLDEHLQFHPQPETISV